MFSHIFLAVANWALLTIIARSFNLAQTGEYNLALATLTPLFLLISLQQKNRFLSDARDIRDSFSDFLFSRLLMTPIALIAAYALTFIVEIPGDFYWSVFLLKVSETFFELPFAFGHKTLGAGKAAIAHFFRTLGTYGFIVFMLMRSDSISQAFIDGALFSVVFSIGIFHFLFKGLKAQFSFHKTQVASYIRTSLSLGLGASALALNVSLPRFFLDQISGAKTVAIYSVSFAFYSIWQLFFNSYFGAVLPHFDKLGPVRKALPLLALALFCAPMLLFGAEIYEFIFGPDYAIAGQLNMGLLLASFISFFSSYFYYEYLHLGALKDHFKVNLIALGANALALWPLIKYFHTAGAYYAWSMALLVQCGLYFYKRKEALKRAVA